MSRRATDTVTTALLAECQRCAWSTKATNGLGNAAKHHDATGHPVTVHVERTITYGDPNAPLDGQTNILDVIDHYERQEAHRP